MSSERRDYRIVLELFAISFLFLFLEIALIRWISGYVKIVAYYTNVILISAFLGAGIGLLIKNRKYINYFPLAILILILTAFIYQIGTFLFFSASDTTIQEVQESVKSAQSRSFLARLLIPEGEFLWNTSNFLIYVVPIIFFLSALVFIPIGQILGEKLSAFSPLKAYTIDISGSLTGILALSALSYFSVQPFWWFLVAFAIYTYFLEKIKFKIIGITLFSVSLVLILLLGLNTIWSPYYKIVLTEPNEFGEFDLTVNDDTLVSSINFLYNATSQKYHIYSLPYLFKKPEDLLIVGAGTGNDVYVAVANGVKNIDAVEIDPKVIQIGLSLHPNKPYSYDNVNIINNDARNYIKTTDKKYDMVIYAILDSHGVFAHQSSVRLDNFVYTKEGIEEAREILKPNGMIVLSFWAGRDWIESKLYNLLKTAFDKEPLVIATGSFRTFVINADTETPRVEIPSTFSYSEPKDIKVITPTDNYPFLYLKNRFKDANYARILVLISIITILLAIFLTPNMKSLSWHFFFLGAGFLLIETKSITEMALMFGSTWIINSFVIAGILVMILLANYYVSKFRANLKLFYILLLAMIIINFLINPSSFLHDTLLVKIFGIAIVSAPIFFAGVIFATSFKAVSIIPNAFGSNILGAVLGGLLEYSSLAFGIKSLYLIALVLYVLSFISIKK